MTAKKKTSSDDPPMTDGGQIIDARNMTITQADDEQVLTGHFCDVVSGEHEGRYGVLTNITSIDSDGAPDQAIIRTRDDRDEDLGVSYSDLRSAQSGRR